MRIKKIIANTVKEGREIIERDLGKDAIILSSRKAKLPNGNVVIEFVAALDDKANIKEQSTMQNTRKVNLYENSSLLSNSFDFKELALSLKSDISNLSNTLETLSENFKYRYTGTMPKQLAQIYKILRNSGVSEEFALNIIGRISAKGLFLDYKKSLNEAQKILLNSVSFANPIMQSPMRQIIAFYGATGCGKTISLVKLAIICKLIYKQNVLIVSADTHKIGGVEQLQTLASISGISFKAAYNATELKNIIVKEKNYNIIMVDTTGCNPNKQNDLDFLVEYHKSMVPDLRFLVLSATTSKNSLLNIIDKFRLFDINSTIITKVDEATGLGNIISALEIKKLPISYFATGQSIPEDFELATSDKLLDYLLMV